VATLGGTVSSPGSGAGISASGLAGSGRGKAGGRRSGRIGEAARHPAEVVEQLAAFGPDRLGVSPNLAQPRLRLLPQPRLLLFGSPLLPRFGYRETNLTNELGFCSARRRRTRLARDRRGRTRRTTLVVGRTSAGSAVAGEALGAPRVRPPPPASCLVSLARKPRERWGTAELLDSAPRRETPASPLAAKSGGDAVRSNVAPVARAGRQRSGELITGRDVALAAAPDRPRDLGLRR
jgi:hypothetical protein